MANQSVIVFGASGNVGDFVLPALLKAGVNVTVATRPSSQSTFPSSVKVVHANYDSLEALTSVIRGHQTVVSLVAGGAVSAQKLLVDAAVAAGATYFLPSEYGHDTTNEQVLPLLPVFEAKREIVAHLREKEKEGLSWTGIITALFFDWGLSKGVLDINLQEGKATLWDGGENLFSSANETDIGEAVARLITDPSTREEFKNQYAYVSSVQTTQKEVVAAAEALTGKMFAIAHQDSEEAFKEGKGLPVLRGVQFSRRGLADYEARVAAGHGKFLVNKKADVKEVLRAVLAS